MLAQFAVIRHENQAFGIVVEAPHVENTLVFVTHDVAQRIAALRVFHGAEHLARLVECEGDVVGVEAHAGTIHAHLLCMGVDPGAQFGDQLAVDFDATVGDHLFALAA